MTKTNTGLDRGMLYLADGSGVPWDGLIAVEHDENAKTSSHYVDGVKHIVRQGDGELSVVIRAFTYPEEFLEYEEGQPFGMAYRTKVDDESAKIHLLYNLSALPDEQSYLSKEDSDELTEFEWTATATPSRISGWKPTAYIILETDWFTIEQLLGFESLLYGDEQSDPRLPSIQEVLDFLVTWGILIITDHGDGTWTATSYFAGVITVNSDGTFDIVGVNGEFLDTDMYVISSTPEP